MSVDEQQHAWEFHKENTAPLERGRNANTLHRDTHNKYSPETLSQNESQIKLFESLVSPSEHEEYRVNDKKTSSDILIHWLSYIKFMQDTYPASTQPIFLLLERCTRALLPIRKYQNDVRFIRVCILYADKTSFPADVYKFLHQNKVGSETALFWVAWAWVMEKKEDFKFCEKIFLKGLAKKAKPFQMLEKRHKQFQRRMCRHMLNRSENRNEEIDENDNLDLATRKSLQPLSRQGAAHNQRSMSFNQENEDRSGHGNPGFIRNQQRRHQEQTGDESQRRTFTRMNTEKNVEQGRSNSSKGVGFEVFVESDSENNGYNLDQENGRNSRQRRLVKDSEKRKENIGKTERWSDRGRLETNTANGPQQHLTRVPSQSGPMFEVFEDENCSYSDRNVKRKQSNRPTALKQKKKAGVADKLNKDPLRYVRNPEKVAQDGLKILNGKEKEEILERGKNNKGIKDSASHAFDEKIISGKIYGQEMCFEEHRAYLKGYKILPSSLNFSLLKENQMSPAASPLSVEMEDVSVATSVRDGDQIKLPSPRRILREGKDRNINLSCISNASSTLNEHDVVGARAEPTINTKFAMHELSMMFSSPGVSSVRKPEKDTKKPFFKVYNENKRMLEENERKCDENESVLKKTEHNPFEVYEDRYEDVDQDQSKENASLKSNDGGDTATFSIFNEIASSLSPICNKNDTSNISLQNSSEISKNNVMRGESNVHHGNDEAIVSGSGTEIFSIYEDTNDEEKLPARLSRKDKHDFAIFEEDIKSCKKLKEKDNESEGDTATFSIFNDIFQESNMEKEMKGVEEKNMKETQISEENKFSTFCDDENVDNLSKKLKFAKQTFTQKNELAGSSEGFEDISRIDRNNETAMTNISVSLFNKSVACISNGVIKYKKIHQQNKKEALEHMLQAAARKYDQSHSKDTLDWGDVMCQAQPVEVKSNSTLPLCLSTKNFSKSSQVNISGFSMTVLHEIGRGSYGVVFLCEVAKEQGISGHQIDDKCVAIKVQRPIGSLVWEHHILKKLHERLPTNLNAPKHKDEIQRNKKQVCGQYTYPFPKALLLASYTDGGILGMTAGSQMGLNLVDIVNLHKVSGGGSVPEILTIHYTCRMLMHIESLHWHGKILHCDVKPDNWVVADSKEACGNSSSRIIAGSELMLVDFGRAIDLQASSSKIGDPLNLKFEGDISAEDMACVAMRNNEPWGIDIDTFGLCASAHVLLYGTYMDITHGSDGRWRPKKTIRRYWQKELWSEFFDSLLNPKVKNTHQSGSHPNSVRAIRKSFERYLDSRTNRQAVVSLLKYQSELLPKSRRK